MDAEYDTSVEGRVARVNERFRTRQVKLFTTFALVEAVAFGTAIVAIYILNLIDPEIGTYVLAGIALAGGLVLSTLLMRSIRTHRLALDQARGESGTIW